MAYGWKTFGKGWTAPHPSDCSRRKRGSVMRRLGFVPPGRETLRRGYAVALKDGRLLKSTADAAAGDAVRLMLQDGSLLTRVETVETER